MEAKETKVTKKVTKTGNDKNKNIFIVASVILLLLVIVSVVLIINNNNKFDDKDGKDKPIEEKKDPVITTTYTEEDLIKAYDFSIKQAEELVMQYYLSDNFECSTTISNEAHYIVTVVETLSGDKYVYDINPASHTYTLVK